MNCKIFLIVKTNLSKKTNFLLSKDSKKNLVFIVNKKLRNVKWKVIVYLLILDHFPDMKVATTSPRSLTVLL